MDAVIVRPKSALTTSYVSGYASPITDTGNTEDTNQDFSSSGGSSDRLMMARKFTATASWYVGSVEDLVLGRTGTPAGTIKLRILNDKSGSPDGKVGGDSDTVSCATLSSGAGGAVQTFTWSDDYPLLIAGQDYWVAMVTTGYTYTDTTTEVRWRTDANGAVGESECAKCINGNVWSIIGADVGADITVKYLDQIIAMDRKEKLHIEIDFTKGDSSGLQLFLETSTDNENWVEHSSQLIQSTEVTIYTSPYVISDFAEGEAADIIRNIYIEGLGKPYVKLSVKAIDDATSAEVGIVAWRY